MIAQEAARHSPATIRWYEQRLGRFITFLIERGIEAPENLSATDCRAFLVLLSRVQLKDNTLHGYAQVVKTFCRFLHREGFAATDAMSNVAMPKVAKRIMPAFAPGDVQKLLKACQSARDAAMVLCLLDSGARGSEFVTLRVGDIDLRTGTVRIIHGKGGKDRTCYLGAKARQKLVAYLRTRSEAGPASPLWVSDQTGDSLTYTGLAQAMRRLGNRAGVANCSPHTFRRTCALWSLRAGMSVYHLQAIMGHNDLEVLRRYLALVEADSQDAHRRFGAVDNML
jgi:integrase/recombinase XerD